MYQMYLNVDHPQVRATSVKQEFEKQDELKRSAMRAVAAILVIPDAGMNLFLRSLWRGLLPWLHCSNRLIMLLFFLR